MPVGKHNLQKKPGLGQENSSPGLQRLNPELHFWKANSEVVLNLPIGLMYLREKKTLAEENFQTWHSYLH